ncbi:MAG: pyridoxamine 5'-phosphate oxidase family protein [Chloroflexi bacterium]|nr:pyridoxamine 5'-phosphate oxidase family protein [Chloroflexota bacterium]
MIELTEEMRAAFDTALTDGVPAIVATAGEAGMPDLAYKGSLMVWDNDRLAFWERVHGTTLQNMVENPHACVLYRNPSTRLAWKFFGAVTLEPTGELRDAVMAKTNEIELSRDPERKGIAVLIRVDKVMAAGRVLMERE